MLAHQLIMHEHNFNSAILYDPMIWTP